MSFPYTNWSHEVCATSSGTSTTTDCCMSGIAPSSLCLPAVEPPSTRGRRCSRLLLSDTGPRRRDTVGRPAAVVEDADPLTRAAAVAALPSLCAGCCGCNSSHPCGACGTHQAVPSCPWCGPLSLIGVHGMAAVAACPARRSSPPMATALTPAAVRLVYVLRDRLAAQLHLLHGCADAAAVLSTHHGAVRLELVEDAGPLAGVGLTLREVDVLALLLARATNEEIAARLVISSATVRAHCRAVLRKLGVARRQDLWRELGRRPTEDLEG